MPEEDKNEPAEKQDDPKDDEKLEDDEPNDDFDYDGDEGDAPKDDTEEKEEQDEPSDSDDSEGEGESPIDATLSLRAEELGLDPADFASPEALAKTINRLSEKKTDSSEKKEEPSKEAEEEEFKIELDPELYDDEIIKAFNKTNTYWREKVGKLETAIQKMSTGVEQRQALEFAERFDGWVGRLDDPIKDQLGTEPDAQISADSPEGKLRIKVMKQMKRMADEGAEVNEELFHEALFGPLGNKLREQERKSIAKKVSKKKFTNRTNSRGGKNRVSEEEDARKWVHEVTSQWDDDTSAEDFL